MTESNSDCRLLERVRALLSKAESSEFAEEADAFTAKAQQLMARHRIEEAMVADAGSVGTPGAIEITVENPYARSKFSLLAGVARANRCQAVYDPYSKVATLVGYGPDQAAVEALYTSLLLQAAAELTRQGPMIDPSGVNRTRSYRNAFWAGFAHRVARRLADANAEVEAEAATGIQRRALPVLLRRSEAVEERVHQLFPHMRRLRTTITNSAGYRDGDAAAQRAKLGSPHQVRSAHGRR